MTPASPDGIPEDAPPLVIVITGPSGVGKDAVIDRAIERGHPIVRPATMTTRAPRPGEQEGVHHYFADSREDFLAHVAAGDLLEHAEVYGNLYGVPRRAVRDALATARSSTIPRRWPGSVDSSAGSMPWARANRFARGGSSTPSPLAGCRCSACSTATS